MEDAIHHHIGKAERCLKIIAERRHPDLEGRILADAREELRTIARLAQEMSLEKLAVGR